MDIFTPARRSRVMSAIRGKETNIEKQVRGELTRAGLRYRKNVRTLEGKPDIAFIGKKIVVFIDSCFWHGCPLHFKAPATRRNFWETKILKNRNRDIYITKEYRKKTLECYSDLGARISKRFSETYK